MSRVHCWTFAAVALSMAAWAGDVLPKPPAPFKGKIDVSREKSTPDWPEQIKAPPGAPNVVLILLDDVGFGAASTFGGAIETPQLDRLARGGLRYNRFHVTAMCAPTRAALLTGRNHHQVGYGPIAEAAAGYPGYNSVWGREYASIAEVLRQNGYSTAAFGKWHNTPTWEVSPAGPFDRWPTGLGFEHFYGFMLAWTSQFEPTLYRGTAPVEPPATPEHGYHLTADLANDAIRWLHVHDAVLTDKPFFLYFATGGTHMPHQAPKEWIDRYKGRFDEGWDKLREEIYARQKRLGVIPANAELSPRPPELPAWDGMSADARKLFARQMEVYAGFLAHTDYEVGRVLQAIRDEGRADNTLVIYIVGDNGASEEAGANGYDLRNDSRDTRIASEDVKTQLARADKLGTKHLANLFAAGWGWATNAPFPWGKQVASHLGGIRDPLIVSWPAKIKDQGALRTQFHHVIDIAPTIYEAVGIEAPTIVNGVKQAPLEGHSMAYSFTQPTAPSPDRVQYFEMVGNRGIYTDGWFAGRRFVLPWEWLRPDKWGGSLDQHPWELYNLDEDYSQVHDVAAQHPEKLKELVALFDREARKYNVYPLAPLRGPQPSPAAGRTVFTYREGVTRLPLRVLPGLAGRSHVLTADIEAPANGAEGVIVAEGGRFGGFSLYVKDGKLTYESNLLGQKHEKLVAALPVPPGKVRIVYEFTADLSQGFKEHTPGKSITPGHGRLSVNGAPAGERDFSWFGGFMVDTFDLGCDLGSPVSDDYASPFSFNGRVEKVTLELK